MSVKDAKTNLRQLATYAYRTIVILLVMEVFVAHVLAYLYLTNFRVTLVPVNEVLTVSPIN